MRRDVLGILDARGLCAADAVAEAVAGDAQASAILRAQAARLRDDGPEALALERALVLASQPHQPHYRPQLYLGGAFDENLTALCHPSPGPEGAGRAFVWLYDDDIETLINRDYDEKVHASPWQVNTEVEHALRAFWAAPTAPPLSLRLHLFEGTERVARVAAELGAAEAVTHVELCRQRRGPEPPVAASFPALRGLACAEGELPDLLARGADRLRCLAVKGWAHLDETLALAARAPHLRHLGLRRGSWDVPGLERLFAHPIMDRLTSLDLSEDAIGSVFPYRELLGLRSGWQYLRRLCLPRYNPGLGALQAAFDECPEVTFVGYDRREVMALDLETCGWAESMR